MPYAAGRVFHDADSHIMEPPTNFLDGLPASLKKHAIHSRREGEFLLTGTEEKIIYRLRVGKHREKELGDAERKGGMIGEG